MNCQWRWSFRNFAPVQSVPPDVPGVTLTNVFTLAELYADQAALDAHRLTPHFLLFKERATAAGFVRHKTAVLGEVLPLK